MTAEDAGQPVVPTDATTDSAAPAETGEGVAQQGDAEDGQPFRWENVPPELEPLAKQFQADYTRKAQALAEQRKEFEAQQQALAGFARLQELAQADPAQAAAVLQQWQQQLIGGQVVPQQVDETDPYALIQPVTETEELLLRELRQIKQQTQEWQQFQEQQKAQEQQAKVKAAWEAMNAEYTQLEQQIGRQLSEAERDQIAGHCMQRGIQSITAGYRDLHWEAEIGRAKQLGRDEASTIVQQKAGAPGAPSTLVARQPSGNALPEFKNDRDLISHLYDTLSAE